MMTVRIYQPCKTAMQSGKRKTNEWRVEFETIDPLIAEPLMGWVSSQDMSQELSLSFATLEEVLQFTKLKDAQYSISTSPRISLTPKSYGTNFTCPRMRGM